MRLILGLVIFVGLMALANYGTWAIAGYFQVRNYSLRPPLSSNTPQPDVRGFRGRKVKRKIVPYEIISHSWPATPLRPEGFSGELIFAQLPPPREGWFPCVSCRRWGRK